MKKALVIFILALFVATGAFAQLSVAGQLLTNLAVNIPFGEDEFNFAEDSNWIYDYLHSGNWLQVAGSGENVSGWVRWRANNSWRAAVNANFAGATFTVGHAEPVARWGRLPFLNDSMWSMGASAVGGNTVYTQIRLTDVGLYVGLVQPGALLAKGIDNTPFPGFYAGYDMNIADIALRVAFVGVPTSKPNDDFVLSFMGNVYALIGNLGPASIAVNASIYSNPEFGEIFTVASAIGGVGAGAGEDNLMVAEGMLDVSAAVGPGTFGVVGGLVTNFDGNRDGIALQVGAHYTYPLAPGFVVIPGAIFRTVMGDDGYADNLRIGLTFRYGF